MKLGTIEAKPGEKAYGFFQTGETHGQFPAHIPLHIVNGAADGPTLVVQAGDQRTGNRAVADPAACRQGARPGANPRNADHGTADEYLGL